MIRTFVLVAAALAFAAPAFAQVRYDPRPGDPAPAVEYYDREGRRIDREGRLIDSGEPLATVKYYDRQGRRIDREGRLIDRDGMAIPATGPVSYDVVRDQQMRVLGMREEILSPYPAFQRTLPNRFYQRAYRLTPADYTRLRAQGFTPDEAYMIANAAADSGLETRIFRDALTRGMTPRDIQREWGITRNVLARVHPEWRTVEWAAAVNEPIYTRGELDLIW